MRKTLKRKRRSCGLCKPNKVGGSSRWKEKEFIRLRSDEKDMREAKKA